MKLVFIDCETTGLDIDRHQVWEVAAIVREYDPNYEYDQALDIEHHWFLPINEAVADPIALDIGRYWDRHPYSRSAKVPTVQNNKPAVANVQMFAREFARLTHKVNWVGAVPDFDAYRLARILKEYGECPTWGYHLVCIENLVAGKLGLQPPWKSDEVFARLGYVRNAEARHTALGDAREVRDIYDLVFTPVNTIKESPGLPAKREDFGPRTIIGVQEGWRYYADGSRERTDG